TTRPHFHCLDTLRGVAALLVAIFHLPGLQVGFAGYVWVDFFLVLSGFVLAHSYLYRESSIGKWEFAVRRFARLWPMHVVALFVTFGAISYPMNGVFFTEAGSNWHNSWTTLVQNLTLTHNIGLPPNGPHVESWNFPSWSISVEFWVNILFILFITKRTRSVGLVLLAALGLGGILLESGSLESHNENLWPGLNSGMVRGISSFVLGIVSYRLYLTYRDRTVSRAIATLVEILSIGVVTLFLYAAHWGAPQWELLAPFAFTLIVPFMACERGWFSQACVPLRHLGAISYSVYLNHLGIWILFAHPSISQHFNTTALIAVEILALLIYSHFTFQYVEKPSQRFLLKRLLPKRAG
ncbi:MAG: acyltransferase, partial [Planctomycetes bacterium]|nr:acyltransferase [Planctomycetota bacterium]